MRHPSAPPGTPLAAAIDVEWSKNYRVRGGNVPFCYSVVWLALSGEDVRPGSFGFWYTSAYVHGTGETGDLVASADSALLTTLERASLIAGHQLSSDLAILARRRPRTPPRRHRRPGGLAAARPAPARRPAAPRHPL